MTDVKAHDQKMSHSYTVHYPAHPPREEDPHYKDFNHYHRTTKNDPEIYQCAMGKARGDFSECSLDKPLELHHSHVEFALQNEVDYKWLEKDYPGISNPDELGAWVESAQNLEWLCEYHHRGSGGVHVISAADFEAEKYVRGLTSD
jgi:hypothetical protein